jgi:RimJ/RimL family protein N-acetyltransferase
MKNKRFDSYPLPDWLQFWVEQNAGRKPLWNFPKMPPTPDGFWFQKLDFRNRYLLLEMFENDSDSWVDERFKDPKEVYEYVAQQRICMPYSGKHGGCDWLVMSPEDECAGILHNFDFSLENFGFQHRKCSVGYAFAEKFRGTGLPRQIMLHFQDYLFKKMDRLLLMACVEKENTRSIRFLEKLGYEERTSDYHDDEEDRPRKEPEHRYLELYRSRRTRNRIHAYRKKSAEDYRAWRATWIKNPDGSYTIPAGK